MEQEAALNQIRKLEEEKSQATLQYNLKNKRGLTSQINKQMSHTDKKDKPPISSSAAKGKKSRAQMAAEAEAKMFGVDPGDDTFLTGLMKGGSEQKKRN